MAKQPPLSQIDITREDVDRFSLLRPLLVALHRDIQELAKKKQDGVLTKSRIAMINRLLKDIKELLSKQPSSPYLDLLDEDSIPQNADGLIIVGQYLSAMNQYFSKYTKTENYQLWWLTGQSAEGLMGR
jgi:hypothetical protein